MKEISARHDRSMRKMEQTHGHRWMKSAERGAAPLALPGRMIVAASAVGAVVLMIAVRAHGGPETWIRHAVLEVAGVEAVMGLVQEAVVGNRWQSAVGRGSGDRVSIDMRRRHLLVAIADLADRRVRRTSGRERRHHGRMMMAVKRREAERVGQSHGTVSLMRRRQRWWRRRRWLSGSFKNVSWLLVAVVITVVARLLPLIILPGLTFDLDAGLRGLGHLDLNPYTVVPVYAGFALDRETDRRSRRGTRRVGVLVAATYTGLLHSRKVHTDSTPWRRSLYDHDGVIALRIGDGTIVGLRLSGEKIGCRLAAESREQDEAENTVVDER